MLRLNRYILLHLIGAFGFFLLIFGGVIWLTQSIRLIDSVITNGQSIQVFLLFSLYVLPTALTIVLPLAGFAATLYIINKLYTEAELVVMMTSGQSPAALLRPVLGFATIVFLLSLLTGLYLVPQGVGRLAEGRANISAEITSALIREGTFLHPTDGVTLFIRDTGDSGQMAGIFLHDQRDTVRPVTYSAERALLLRDGDLARLIMSRGLALTYNAENNTMSQVRFTEFVYDLSAFMQSSGIGIRRPEVYPLPDLLWPSAAMLSDGRYDRGDFVAEGHQKITTALNALILPVIALAVMLSGVYLRRGFARRILVAVGLGVVMVVGGVGGKSTLVNNPDIWPVQYVPVAAMILLALVLLTLASRPKRRPRAQVSA